MLNGRRVTPSTITGAVDVNTIPQALVQRVDVVTGGAAATWGSDAVSGVVNFILDTKFKGLRLEAQGGLSERGDSGNYTFSGAFGTKLGERGHILLGGEYFHQDGVHSFQGRDWYQSWGTVPDASGKAEAWSIELNSPNNMRRQGWKATSLKAGDEVSVVMFPLRDLSDHKGGLFVEVTLPDGSVLKEAAFAGNRGPVNVPTTPSAQ